jgi:hypothetical protein
MDEEVPRGGFVIGCQSPFIPGIWLVDPESGVVPVGRYLVGFPNASPVFIPEYKKVPKGGRVIGHQAPGFCIRLLNLRDGEVLVGEYYVWCPQHNIRYSIRVCDPVPEGDVIFGYRYPCPNATPIESRLASLVT